MSENQEKLNRLLERLETLDRRQQDFFQEIISIKKEIQELKEKVSADIDAIPSAIDSPELEKVLNAPINEAIPLEHAEAPVLQDSPIQSINTNSPTKNFNLEKYIGENLINKVGIIITILGVAIGAKYSIDHDLISPLTRIILGYLTGIGLLAFGIKFKEKYENYSAVLVSGAIAIMYFITYAGYSYYGLIPQLLAFLFMVFFTVFAVVAAINYDRKVIAHIGLLGAYAVPILLSDGSGRVMILFSYIAIINFGILFISFQRDWKSLFYMAFGLTWLLYLTWYATDYQSDLHFGLAMGFALLFFLIFYATFLAYKLIKKETFNSSTIIMLLSNSFLYYGVGYMLLSRQSSTDSFLGLYTLGNAILHFGVCVVIYRQKLADKNLFYLVSGLVLVFITMAIPVQLDGNWVTLLWVGEAALLFWIGSTRNIIIYQRLSYPLMVLASASLVQDWRFSYFGPLYEGSAYQFAPIFNIHLLSSLLFSSAFAFISYFDHKHSTGVHAEFRKSLSQIFSVLIPGIFIASIYFVFRLEIIHYYNQLFIDSKLAIPMEGEHNENIYNAALHSFGSIWITNYSVAFFSLLAFINLKKFKSYLVAIPSIGLLLLTLLIFLVQGLYEISELRETYLDPTSSQYYQRGFIYIGIRYISLAMFGVLLYSLYAYSKESFLKFKASMVYDILLSISIIWILSSELLHWLDFFDAKNSYKLALSIFWGSTSLLLVVLGIWKGKAYLRILAMILFGITLVKLFFYDIEHLTTIAKTIVFVSLGVLLLIISFLYNKYKSLITDDSKD